MDELNFWGFIHSTGSGCVSIAMWEGMRTMLAGPALILAFSGATALLLHLVHRHHKHIVRKYSRRSGS